MKQLIPWGVDDAPSSATPQYQCLGGNGEVTVWTGDEAEVLYVMPTAGKLTGLSVSANSSVPTGKSLKVLARQNFADTALVAELTNNNTQASSSTDVTVADNDLVCLKTLPTNSPTVSKMYGSIEFIPDNEAETILLGGTGESDLAGTAKYLTISGQANGANSIADVQNVITSLNGGLYGTLKKMRVRLENAPTSTFSRTFTLYHNGTPTSMTVTISGNDTTADVYTDIEINDGDTFALYATVSGNATNTKAYWGFVIEPVTQGEYLLLGTSRFSLPTQGTSYEYNRIASGASSWTATKTDRRMGGGTGHTIKCIGLKTSTAPSTINDNKGYELWIENPSSGGQRALVEGTNTYNKSDEMTWSVNDYAYWNVRTYAYNSPNPAKASWCTVMQYVG